MKGKQEERLGAEEAVGPRVVVARVRLARALDGRDLCAERVWGERDVVQSVDPVAPR